MKVDKYYSPNEAQAVREERPVEPAPKPSSSLNLGIKLDSLIENRYLLIGIMVIIAVLAIYLRISLLQYQGLFEPDGFFYYSVIRQAVASHYVVSNYLDISGFANHNFIGEAVGLPYLTVIFYFILHGFTSLTALQVMRWLPVAFGVLYAILAYLIAQHLSKSRALGLLAMFFVAVSSGNIARTAATVYRGDSFITLFILLALLFMLKCFEQRGKLRIIIYALLSAVSLSLGIVVWNGAPFIMVVYMLAILLTIVYGFIKKEGDVLFVSLVLSVTLLLANLLQRFYVSIGLARSGLQLVSADFFIFYAPILIASAAAYYIIKHLHRFRPLESAKNRAVAMAGVFAVGAIILLALFHGQITAIASPLAPTAPSINVTTNATNSTVSTSIQQTTQELQAPSLTFLWSSFNLQLYLAPFGVAIFLILAFLISRGERFIKRDHFALGSIGFLVIAAYFLVTAYMQAGAIRFNAIISMPISIFAAFGVYAAGKLFYHSTVRNRAVSTIILVATLALTIDIILNFQSALGSVFVEVAAAVLLICITLVMISAYDVYAVAKNNLKVRYVVLAAVMVILLYNFYNTMYQSYTAVQADGINPQFLQAMTWLKNNTASNATVLALWPDGSVVEGWGNRSSYMDSVGGENGTRIYYFSKFLFNTSTQTQYLYRIGRPEYLVARTFWYQELGGIAQEGLVANASAYGYVVLGTLNSTSNGTATFFTFSTDSYPYYRAELVIQPVAGANNTTINQYSAYLGIQNSSRAGLMKSIIFLNSSNGAYTIINKTGNDTINYTLLVSFAGREVNGGYVLGPKLVQSNVFKFTFLCNTLACAYDNSNVSLTSVFENGDTRIFKINYLKQ